MTHTNKRTDEWGGAYENRIRLPVRIVSDIRKAVGKEFIIIYRLSMLDLIKVCIVKKGLDRIKTWGRMEVLGMKLYNWHMRLKMLVRRLLILELDGMKQEYPRLVLWCREEDSPGLPRNSW